MDEEWQVELTKSLADNEEITAIYGQNAKMVTDIIQAIQDMKIHAQNVKKAETPAFMKINDKIVNKKLEELQSLMWLPCLQSYPLLMGTTQFKHSMTKIVVHLGKETLAVTQTKEALPTEETPEGDTVEVTRVTTGVAEIMVIEVDTMQAADKDKMISIVKGAETGTVIEEDALGMETEIKVKMKEEIIVTIVTIEKTEISVKTDN